MRLANTAGSVHELEPDQPASVEIMLIEDVIIYSGNSVVNHSVRRHRLATQRCTSPQTFEASGHGIRLQV